MASTSFPLTSSPLKNSSSIGVGCSISKEGDGLPNALDLSCISSEDDKPDGQELLRACLDGDLHTTTILIDNGGDLTVQGDHYDTPLHISLREGHLEIATKIVQVAKESGILKDILIKRNGYSMTPIHLAVINGHEELVEISLDHVFETEHSGFSDLINCRGGERYDTPLHEASTAGHHKIATLLMEKGASVNVTNWYSETPLHHACKENHREVAKSLAQYDADFSVKNEEGLTPLQVAANVHTTIDILLDQVDRYERTRKVAWELMGWAVAENKSDLIKQLLRYKSKLMRGRKDEDIIELVLKAATKGHTETVAALIQWNQSDIVECTDEQGNTPLHLASEAGHDQTVKELIRARAKVEESNSKDVLERTPLHLASANGWVRTARQLIKAEAAMDKTDLYGITPLHLACKNGHIEVVKLLINENNANIILRDNQGLNCLDYAIDNGHEAIANLILSHGKWHEVMSISLGDGCNRATPMRKLLRTMPDTAKRVMDKCVKTSSPDAGPKDSDSWVEFDYEFLEDTFSHWNRPNGKQHLKKDAKPYTDSSKDIADNHPLNIMVSSGRTDLLSHPLVSSLLYHKWSRHGWYLFWLYFGFYLFFVAMLTGYVIVVPPSFYAPHGVNGEQQRTRGFDEATIFFFGRVGDWIVLILSLIHLYFEHWQWQCGAVAVFLAWINLILFIRRLPGLGIYVIMINDILRRFLKFVVILSLFVIAFALAFYTLLMNQQPFHSVPLAFAKTFVMMIGELDFDAIFHSQNYLGTENTFADGEEDFFLSSVYYGGLTYAFFFMFLIVMSIVMMNLLVGLAVDDVSAIQQKAKLHRLVLQVELVMELQCALPISMWRSAVIRSERFTFSRSCFSSILMWWNFIFTGDHFQEILRQAIQVYKKTTTEDGSIKEQSTTDQLFAKLKHRLKLLDTKVETMNGSIEKERTQVRDEQTQLKERLDRLEMKIDSILNHLSNGIIEEV